MIGAIRVVVLDSDAAGIREAGESGCALARKPLRTARGRCGSHQKSSPSERVAHPTAAPALKALQHAAGLDVVERLRALQKEVRRVIRERPHPRVRGFIPAPGPGLDRALQRRKGDGEPQDGAVARPDTVELSCQWETDFGRR